ncbi:MAG: DUF2066 domain-containing protein [Alphaproteobacteria bacterium]|nr:DUF2066 domain-containing protein [Alphaproteobacteria bacterium]
MMRRPIRFLGALTAFAAVAGAVAIVAGNEAARAADRDEKAYKIANFPIEAKAENAVAAKKIAIADGQSAALRSLLKRIVPVSAYARLRQMAEVDAAQYVEGISVRGEQNSATEYFASLDFKFSADGVRDLLRQNGVPFIDTQAPQTTLVPVVIGADGTLQGSAGAWSKIWNSLDVANALTPLSVSELRPTLHQDVLRGLAEGDDARGMRILAAEYGGSLVVVASAEVDAAQQRLKVSVMGRDATGPINWSRAYRIYDGDSAYAMELAAVVTLGVLEGRWKAAQARQSGGIAAMSQPDSDVRVEVLFDGARDWYRMQSELSGLNGVRDFRVNAVSARSADVSMAYPGGGAGLANALARQGYQMTDSGGRWVLRQRF